MTALTLRQRAAQPPTPGFVGKRYLVCTDNLWHLVLGVLEDFVADTQCCADTHVAHPQVSAGADRMCQECVNLHFGKPR